MHPGVESLIAAAGLFLIWLGGMVAWYVADEIKRRK